MRWTMALPVCFALLAGRTKTRPVPDRTVQAYDVSPEDVTSPRDGSVAHDAVYVSWLPSGAG